MKSLAERFYFASPVTVQNVLVSVMGYRLFTKRYTGNYHKIRKELEELASMGEAQVKAMQEENLHSMVSFCYENIAYYQELFANQELKPVDITTLEDLVKIPVLDKNTLVAKSKLFQPRNPCKPYAVQHTSGSTGTPLALNVNERTYKLAMALLVDHEESHGIPFGSRRATFAGRMLKPADDMKPPFSRFNRSENQRLFSSYHINENTFPHYKKELDKFQPKELIGYPSAIYDLAAHYLKSDSKPGFQPKAVITNSETLLLWQREKIESVFGCPVYDYYGTAEYVTFAGQDKDGIYRTNPIIGITELVTDEASDENSGRIVATSLTNKAMPLLRYDLGDTATLAYSSGTQTVGTPAFISIDGRQDDYIETTDGRRIGRLDHVFKGIEGIKESQILQSQPGSITIKVVKDGFGNFNESSLRSNCKERLGDDFNVSLEYTSEIPKGRNGKFRSVIKELK